MNKRIKWVLIIIIPLMFIGWYVYYATQYGIKEIFNMQEVLGPDDNNQYGIRNDVYTYLVENDFKKFNLGKKEQYLVLNYAKITRLMTKYFYDKDKIIELNKIELTIIDCLSGLNTTDWDHKTFSGGYYGPSVQDIIYNTTDRKLIYKIIDNYFAGTILYNFDYKKNKEECTQYMEKIYDEK